MVQGDLGNRFHFATADWNKFRVESENKLGDISSEGSIAEFNDSLSKVIIDATTSAIPCKGTQKDRLLSHGGIVTVIKRREK